MWDEGPWNSGPFQFGVARRGVRNGAARARLLQHASAARRSEAWIKRRRAPPFRHHTPPFRPAISARCWSGVWGRPLADLCCGGPEPAPAEPRSSSMRAWAGPAADLRASLPAHRVLLAEGACYVPSTLSPAECRRKRKKYLDQKKLVAAGQVARFLLDLVAFRQIRSSIHSTWPAVVFRASLLCSQTTPQRQLRHGLPTQ